MPHLLVQRCRILQLDAAAVAYTLQLYQSGYHKSDLQLATTRIFKVQYSRY